MIKTSVVILTKNPGAIFQRVLSATLEQSAPWEYEVLVVDSGSTDGTIEFIKANPLVNLLEISPEDFGHGRTRNLAISKTQGEFVVMLTHDALPASDTWLLELVNTMEQASDIAGAFGRHIAYPQDGPLLERDLRLHFDGFLNYQIVYIDDQTRYDNDIGFRQLLHFFSDNNSCIRRSVWQEIPYPDVDFAEDQIWAKKIIEAGYKKAYADQAAVYHSHNFGFFEQFRRSFDEARALRKLFDYRLCPNIIYMILQSIRTTVMDWKYLFSINYYRKDWTLFFRVPLRNVFKQIGLYLGQRSESLPEKFVMRISRDHSIKNSGKKD